MANYAVVPLSGGKVNNIVVGDSLEQVRLIVGNAVEITEETGRAGIGYIWDGITFSAPSVEEEEEVVEVVVEVVEVEEEQ
jgi:hypothetical protein